MRFVCISDDHGGRGAGLPEGDVLIHAGDLCNWGDLHEAIAGAKFLGGLPYPIKICIAGNHDKIAEADPGLYKRIMADNGVIYLQDEEYRVKTKEQNEAMDTGGIRVYGTPWQPYFLNWAFNIQDPAERRRRYNGIPEGTDILITHCAPYGFQDLAPRIRLRNTPEPPVWEHTGCPELLEVTRIIRPKYHIFGHIHVAWGMAKDGDIWRINCALVDDKYDPTRRIIVFDYGQDPFHVDNLWTPPDGNPAAWENRE